MSDPREPYGRIVHGIRLAFNADLPHPRGVLPWEEREAGQQEMDMRIGAAVANYALTENAVSWDTSCTSCARVLDSAYAETVRREAAEAKVAEMRQVVVSFRNRNAGTLDDQASDVISGVLQVADRTPLGAQGRSDEEEAGRG